MYECIAVYIFCITNLYTQFMPVDVILFTRPAFLYKLQLFFVHDLIYKVSFVFQSNITALMVAAYCGSSHVIEVLLCAKADVNTCVTAGEVGQITLCLEHAIFSCLSVTKTCYLFLLMKIAVKTGVYNYMD